jgi:RNA polymerase sigma factor (sigma-70 family)
MEMKMTVSEFVKQYHNLFVTTVMKYQISRENAEDICQNCYVKWLKKNQRFQTSTIFFFIRLAAYRAAFDYKKIQNRKPQFVSIDEISDILVNDMDGLIEDEELVKQYSSAKSKTQSLETVIKHYVLGKAKSQRIFDLLVQYNSGSTMREIAETLQMNVALVHKEIVEWRKWIKQLGEG